MRDGEPGDVFRSRLLIWVRGCLLALATFSCASGFFGSCSCADRPNAVPYNERIGAYQDLVEAAFRYMFDNNQSSLKRSAPYFFLAEEGGADPAAEFLSRFSEEKPLVLPASEADTTGSSVVRRGDGQRGVLFAVNGVEWVRINEAKVEVSYREGMRSGAGQRFFMRRDDRSGKWNVSRVEGLWVN